MRKSKHEKQAACFLAFSYSRVARKALYRYKDREMNRKNQVEETLHCLIGHPLWGTGRVANLLSFQFGPRRWRTNLRGQADDEEYWRFFQPATDLPHFVVTSQGIEDQVEETE